MTYKIYALGQDIHWLKAVAGIADDGHHVNTIHCCGQPECLGNLRGEADALILVDAAGEADRVALVRQLRSLGWRHIVVVAADPSWRDACLLLREAGASDYWSKSYVPEVIRRDVDSYLAHQQGTEAPRRSPSACRRPASAT